MRFAFSRELTRRLIPRQERFHDGTILPHDDPHALFDASDIFLRQSPLPKANFDEQSFVCRKIHFDFSRCIELVNCRDEQEDDTAPIDIPSFFARERKVCDDLAPIHRILQIMYLTIEIRRSKIRRMRRIILHEQAACCRSWRRRRDFLAIT